MDLDFETIWSALPIPAMIVSADGRIDGMNQAAENFVSVSSRHIEGHALSEYLGTSSRIVDLVNQASTQSVSVVQYDVELGWHDKRLKLGTLQANPVGNQGQVLLLLNPRGLAEKMDRSLGYRSAARSVTGMAAMLAHEIRNPLAGISGAAQLLAMNLDDADREITTLIQDEARRIGDLVTRVEAFGDQGPVVAHPVNIHDVLDRTVRAAKAGFAAHVRFTEDYDPSLPPTVGDADQLIQVFQNLIKNAAEAVPQSGGVINIRTGFRPGVRLTIPGTKSSGLPLEVVLTDNGRGIAQDLIESIFDPFVTTKAAGSGLGLSLVSKILAAHGGVIECESLDTGTAFRILLPVWDGPLKSGEP